MLGLENEWELCCGTARVRVLPAILAGGRWASTHTHPPGWPGSGLGAALAPGGLGREQGTAGCACKLCESLC